MPQDVSHPSNAGFSFVINAGGNAANDYFAVHHAGVNLLKVETDKEVWLAGDARIASPPPLPTSGPVVFECTNSNAINAFAFSVGSTSKITLSRTGYVAARVAVPIFTTLPSEPSYEGQIVVEYDANANEYRLCVGGPGAVANSLRWYKANEIPRP